MIRAAAVALVLTVAAAGCMDPAAGGAPPVADTSAAAPASGVPYDLANPDDAIRLPRNLLEISGLGIRPDGRLLAIYDEAGILFELDASTGAPVAQRRFAGAGDYEGVEWVDGVTWILRSDGTLRRFPDGSDTSTRVDTHLRSRCDAEGLGYDHVGRVLLVLCKEDPGEGYDGARSVFSFDPTTNTLSATPILLIDRRAVDGREQFKPSAIAVHPQTRRVYIVSSVRKLLVVLSPEGTLEGVAELDAGLLPQPEGIAFAPDGTLFISSEGVSGPAMLLRFSPRP